MAEETEHCVFCKIANGDIAAKTVYEDPDIMAFLDNRPLFPGHVLVCPRDHFDTLYDLPPHLVGSVFLKTQMIGKAVEAAVDAQGTFVAINNRVSQSVPHLHVHVVPRRRRDGLKGFFWPRRDYVDDVECEAVRQAIKREIHRLLN